MHSSEELKHKLLSFYAPDGPERVGFILASGELVEAKNIHPSPLDGFCVGVEDLLRYCNRAVGTWHTHPGKDSNLSMEDYRSFKLWHEQTHFIIGSDGIRAYKIERGSLLCLR